MRVIKRRIYLERLKSRVPGLVPSYNLNSDKMEFFDINGGTSNYGMIPAPIKVKNKDGNDEYITFNDLMAKYRKAKKESDYENEVINLVENKYVPMFDLTNKSYKKGWNCDFLYLIDAKKWRNYLNELSEKKENKSANCCERNEFDEKGGDSFISDIDAWIEGLKVINNEVVDDYNFSLSIPILFTNTIDDIGEFTIFSKDWSEGEQYTNGTSVIYNNNVFIKEKCENNGELETGSYYSDRYLESFFASQKEINKNDYDKEWYEKGFTQVERDKHKDNDKWINSLEKEEEEWDALPENTDEDELKKRNYDFRYLFINHENLITGSTESKLYKLVNTVKLVDNLGFELIGSPLENDSFYTEKYMDIPYRVGNVSELKLLNEKDGEKYYWGNILTEIVLHFHFPNKYLKYNEKTETDDIHYIFKLDKYNSDIKDDEVIKRINYDNRTSPIHKIINDITVEVSKVDSDMAKRILITCDFVYYIGAIIKLDKTDNLYKYVGLGVKYTDNVKLKKIQKIYHINKEDKIDLNCYELLYDEKKSIYNEYNNKSIKFKPSNIEHRANNKSVSEEENENCGEYIEKYDGFINAPIFREEYKFGSSSLENVEGNIYIDRGVSSAVEKHMKLLEVNSLESLEQYGNGFFKIIKD